MRQVCLAMAALVLLAGLALPAPGAKLATQLRRPVAAVLSADDQRLYVANAQSGTLSLIDLAAGKVLAEQKLAARLADLVATPDRRTWLALDSAEGALLRIVPEANGVRVLERLPVDATAVQVVVSSDGRRAYVAGLWSRRISVVELGAGEAPSKIIAKIDLEIAPRTMLLVQGDTRLIAADSFSGRLAVIDTEAQRWLHTSEFPAHNIRGLALSKSGETLIVSHQMLNDLGHTVENDVHWGLVMTNDLRWLPLETIVGGGQDLYRGAHMHPLGHPNRGSADPMGLAVAPDGRVVVALGGVGQVALGKESDFSLARARVGERPTFVVATSDSRHAWVLNTFGDSLSQVDLEKGQTLREVSLGPQPELSRVQEGERLFYDASLSLDGWMSCHSCHSDGHTNGQKNDNFSDKTFGAPKRVMSLLTTTESAPFGWRGLAATLDEQIQNSVFHTMQGGKADDKQVAALAAYLRTLQPPPSIDAARGAADRPAIARGQALFRELKCVGCHAPPAYTTPKTYDVGLADELDHRRYNPPSLLGVGQRAPYFHDGRAARLRDVLEEHGHQLDRALEEEELSDLLKFLRSL